MLTPLCTAETAVNPEQGAQMFMPVRCKRWSCPHCAQANRWRVICEAVEGKPRSMLTLTVSSKRTPDPAEAAALLKKGLRRLRQALARHPRYPNFEFIAIVEKHESGHPHLHLLIRGGYVPQRWLSKKWREFTGSHKVDIRKIKGRKDAARYVAKYLGKDLSKFEGCKRYWRSHGYPPKVKPDEARSAQPSPWRRYFENPHKLADYLHSEGWKVTRKRNDKYVYEPPPDDPRGIVTMIWQRQVAPTTHSDVVPLWRQRIAAP